MIFADSDEKEIKRSKDILRILPFKFMRSFNVQIYGKTN
jgi:hypothetical protein